MPGLRGRVRFLILFIVLFVNVSNPLACRNVIYAIQPMINHTAIEGRNGSKAPFDDSNLTSLDLHSDTCHSSLGNISRHEHLDDGPYLFDAKKQAWILSALAMGQLCGTLFALLIYDFVYLGPILSMSQLWIGLLNLCLPFIAQKVGSVGVIISRFSIGLYIGLLTPANNVIANRWFTHNEKNLVMAILSSGSNIGNILFALSGLANEYLGWESLFWIPGSTSIVASILVSVFFTDDPSNNRFLSDEEKRLLDHNWSPRDEYNSSKSKAGKGNTFRTRSSFHKFGVAIARMTRRKPAPWFKALGYLQIWALLAGVFGHCWACEATMTYTQIYLMEIHNYSLNKASLLNTVPTNISIVLFGVMATKVADYCLHNELCTKATVRRIGGVVLATTGVFFILMGTLPCNVIDNGIIGLLIFSSFRSGTYVSLLPAFRDISPTYQDTLFTMSMVVGFIPGFVVPALIGIVGKETRKQWLVTFVISACVIFVSVGFFIFSIRPEIQEFDEVALQNQKSKAKKKVSWDLDTEPEQPKKPGIGQITPLPAAEFAARTWPEGTSNIKRTVWDTVNPADIQKIFMRVSAEVQEPMVAPVTSNLLNH